MSIVNGYALDICVGGNGGARVWSYPRVDLNIVIFFIFGNTYLTRCVQWRATS